MAGYRRDDWGNPMRHYAQYGSKSRQVRYNTLVLWAVVLSAFDSLIIEA